MKKISSTSNTFVSLVTRSKDVNTRTYLLLRIFGIRLSFVTTKNGSKFHKTHKTTSNLKKVSRLSVSRRHVQKRKVERKKGREKYNIVNTLSYF